MESRRRIIEVDEDVAAALEKRAAERGVSLDEFLSDVSTPDAPTVELSPEELAELDERIAEWERSGEDLAADEVFDRLIGRAEARVLEMSRAPRD